MELSNNTLINKLFITITIIISIFFFYKIIKKKSKLELLKKNGYHIMKNVISEKDCDKL